MFFIPLFTSLYQTVAEQLKCIFKFWEAVSLHTIHLTVSVAACRRWRDTRILHENKIRINVFISGQITPTSRCMEMHKQLNLTKKQKQHENQTLLCGKYPQAEYYRLSFSMRRDIQQQQHIQQSVQEHLSCCKTATQECIQYAGTKPKLCMFFLQSCFNRQILLQIPLRVT